MGFNSAFKGLKSSLLWSLRVHYCACKSQSLVLVLNQTGSILVLCVLHAHILLFVLPNLLDAQEDVIFLFFGGGKVTLLTYSMVQSRSWEANWFAASQEIPRILWNPKVHYRAHKRPSPVPVLGQPNPVHIPTSHLLEINPNIIHPSTPRSPQWSLSLRFPHQDPTRPPLLTHTRHMPSPSHSSQVLTSMLNVSCQYIKRGYVWFFPHCSQFIFNSWLVNHMRTQHVRCLIIKSTAHFTTSKATNKHCKYPELVKQKGYKCFKFYLVAQKYY